MAGWLQTPPCLPVTLARLRPAQPHAPTIPRARVIALSVLALIGGFAASSLLERRDTRAWLDAHAETSPAFPPSGRRGGPGAERVSDGVSLVTHLGVSRLGNLTRLLELWPGNVTAAVGYSGGCPAGSNRPARGHRPDGRGRSDLAPCMLRHPPGGV